jgi:hypothetical protein
MRDQAIVRSSSFSILAIVVALCLPLLVHAQSAAQSDLSATIRAELLSDPRTQSLTSTQLDAMVNLLTQKAAEQGLTAKDIMWHPANSFGTSTVDDMTASAQQSSDCVSGFTCVFDEAFGFVGPDNTIPFVLGAASMGLVWTIAEMIHRRRHIIVPPRGI